MRIFNYFLAVAMVSVGQTEIAHSKLGCFFRIIMSIYLYTYTICIQTSLLILYIDKLMIYLS